MAPTGSILSWKRAGAIFVAGLALWFAWGVLSGEEGKIKKRIKAAAEAVEKEDALGLLAFFSNDYQDETGLTYPTVFKIAQMGFAQFEDIDVDVRDVNIEINGDRAVVTLSAWGEGTRASTMGGGQPAVREAFSQTGVRLGFAKSGGKWLIEKSERIALEQAIK